MGVKTRERLNPLADRREKVARWLDSCVPALQESRQAARLNELMSLSFKNFDALHLSTAEFMNADLIATCDDRFLAAGKKHAGRLRVPMRYIVEVAQELLS